jgi:hypothetical protein
MDRPSVYFRVEPVLRQRLEAEAARHNRSLGNMAATILMQFFGISPAEMNKKPNGGARHFGRRGAEKTTGNLEL